MKAVAAICALACSFFVVPTLAAVVPYQEYDKRVKSSEMVQGLKSDLFGDNVSLYNGATEFSTVDIDLPGNNALPVRLGRTFRVELRNIDSESLGGFGAWDIDVPYMHGTFTEIYKWNESGNGATNRCSQLFFAKEVLPVYSHEIWSGTKVHIPGSGDQSVLWSPPEDYPHPSDGATYYWNTRDNLRFKCTTMLNYPGEGFIAVDANGTQYTFNYAIERRAEPVKKYSHGVELARKKIYIVATQVRDRHGNYVNYEYYGDQLYRIVSSDGRTISLTYSNGHIVTASAHGREWHYSYSEMQFDRGNSKALTQVTQPDQSSWRYEYNGSLILAGIPDDGETGGSQCREPAPDHGAFELVATHPSGAVGSFHFEYIRHGISGTPANACSFEGMVDGVEFWTLHIPNYYYLFSLTQKSLSGPGIASPQQWQYFYGNPLTERANYPYTDLYCTSCDEEKTNIVVQPDGSKIEYAYGVLYNYNDGRLLGTYTRQADNTIVKSERHLYVSEEEAPSMPFPARFGESSGSFDQTSIRNRPIKQTVISLEGDIPGPVEYVPPPPPPPPPPCPECPPPPPPECDPLYPWLCEDPMLASTGEMGVQSVPTTTLTMQVNTFDAFARPVSVTRASSLGHSRTEVTVYHDNLSKWVLGQVASVTNLDTTPNVVTSRTEYDPATALPIRVYGAGTTSTPGQLVQTFTYNADGTFASVTDGNSNTVLLSNWKRGIPQLIQHPGTPDQPDGVSESAVVDDSGWIRSVTDENGFTTNYGYDAMGRLSSVAYPASDSVAWNTTTRIFEPVAVAEYGISAGHWRQTVSTGNARRVTYFDAMWRPLVEEQYDATDIANTLSQTVKRYNAKGLPAFQSYPTRGITDHTAVTVGSRTIYDALDRVTRVEQDSELGVLSTQTEHLPGFQTRVTNPRGQATTTSYMAFDQPVTDWPISIAHPEGVFTDITRDIFGKPKSLRRRNADNTVNVTRQYVYDEYQQMCKSIEPETGATVLDYDAAGNLAWSASGLGLPDASTCDRATALNSGRAAHREYDPRNRLRSLSFPDMNGNQIWTYAPDNLPLSITTLNAGGTASAVNAYSYNKRRLLIGESLNQTDWPAWSIGYGYDANGSLAAHTYPEGLVVDYAPNALGQPTKAGGYASNVSYHPNGGMAQFTYGNGIVHTLTQNTRGLPDRSKDAYGTTSVLDDGYDYDANGNVAAISDGLPAARGNRTMTYDGLDRLTGTVSPMFSPATYSYDVLDNLKTVKVAGRDHTYVYDANNRLTNVAQTADGATVVGLGYDVQGNLENKNGVAYRFDYGNRLREVIGRETYRYDGHGRRVLATHPSSGQIVSLYGQDGTLRFQLDARQNKKYSYIPLNGSLVARTVSDAFPPDAPLLSGPTLSTTGTYPINWSAIAGTTEYQLEESFNSGAWQSQYSGISLTKTFTGKTTGSYRYRVRACNGAGCGNWSAIATVAVELPPASPPTLTVPSLGANGSYTISWTAVAGATGYALEESANGGAWTPVNTTALSRAYTGVATGNYTYRIKACNSTCSAYSASGTVQVVYTPATAPALTAPASVTTGSYTVSWTAVTTATTYRLEEQANGGTWTLIHNAAGTSKAVSGKTAGTYGYRVKACNAAGCGPLSSVVNVVDIDPPAGVPTPSAPASVTNGSYTVSWTAVSGATTYKLEEQLNAGAWTVIHNAAGTLKAISGKTGGTYGYRVAACNAAGCGPYSSTVNVIEIDAPATAAVLSAPASVTAGSYTVSWTAVTSAATYQLEEQVNGGTWTLIQSAASTSKAITGKTGGTYGYRVMACNAAGCGPQSAVTNVVEIDPPSGQIVVSAPTSVTNGSYTVSWNAVAGATSYQLEERLNSGAWTLIYNGSATSRAISGKTAGTYGYQARACNAAGCGPTSLWVNVVEIDPPASAPTLTVPSSSSSGSYTVSWTAVSGATSYKLEEQANGGTWTLIHNSGGTSKAISGKANGTYGYRITACNAAGCGPTSGISTVSVALVPSSAPTLYTSGLTDEFVPYQVWWSTVSAATRYELEEYGATFWYPKYSGSQTTWASSGMPVGIYQYRVRACNSVGCGPYSAVQYVEVRSMCSFPPCDPMFMRQGEDK